MSDIVGKVKIDFEVIPTYNIYTLWVADSSDWKYLIDKEATLGIKLPSSSKEILHAFKKKSLNIFNSNNLGLSCVKECAEQEYVSLPDGMYTVTLYSSNVNERKTRYFFKTDTLQLDLDKAFVKLGFEYKEDDEEFIKNLNMADFLLKATHAAARRGEVVKAQSYFEASQDIITKYKDCKNCY